MSTSDPIQREQALEIAKDFLHTWDIYLLCKDFCIGGSIRRNKPYVGDIEIIIQPKYAPNLLAHLDKLLLMDGVIRKAHYGKDRTTRWGSKYRGLNYLFQPDEYHHVKIEIFLAEEHNWGYHQWLRTGPGQANTYIMSKLKWDNSPLRFKDGDAIFQGNKRLHIPTEDDLFKLLKMTTILPEHRSESMYRIQLRDITYSHMDTSHLHWEPIQPESSQQKLF